MNGAPVPTAGRFRVTLLGTGTPVPSIERFGAATLIEAGDRKLLIDAGRGATIRLWQIGIPLSHIDRLFITHYHSDHVCGIPDLWLTGWLPGAGGMRSTPFRVIGPPGARALMDRLADAYSLDISIRLADEGYPPAGIASVVEEFAQDGVVYEESGVRVMAFEVDHGAAIKPAYGYRIEYGGRAVVISGDTRYCANLVCHAMEADLLVHEVCCARPALLRTPMAQRIMAHHTSPREAGRVFTETRPRLAAFTHLVMLGNDAVDPMSIDELARETRETYDGPLEVGEDLVSFDIGESITVTRGDRAAVVAMRRPLVAC
jgi:ribonuclease Z